MSDENLKHLELSTIVDVKYYLENTLIKKKYFQISAIMYISQIIKQFLVAGSPQLAALSAGGIVAFPSVLLHQIKENDTSISIDFNTASWIGSIHSLAGIPSILMPTIMQWKGRKFAFVVTCLIIIIGWVLTYFAESITSVLIGEVFHGFGANSMFYISYATIGEMVTPKFRTLSMISYGIVDCLGLALVSIMGRYLHWKTISLLLSVPIVIAMMLVIIWPESPSWLACKGRFEECQQAFIWLRGTDEASEKELMELIYAQKEILENCQMSKGDKFTLRAFWRKVTSRDFYLPTLHTFVILLMIYWSGVVVLLIYSTHIIEKTTTNEFVTFISAIVFNWIFLIGNIIATMFTKYFNNKPVLLLSSSGTIVTLFSASVVSYLQTIGVLSKDSVLCFYFFILYVLAGGFGLYCIGFAVAVELMPVKHRGAGGALYTIFACILQSLALKTASYLFQIINLWGTFLLYMLIVIICSLYVWKYVPRTKNRSLQELEDYYMGFDRKRMMEDDSVVVPICRK